MQMQMLIGHIMHELIQNNYEICKFSRKCLRSAEFNWNAIDISKMKYIQTNFNLYQIENKSKRKQIQKN